MSPSIVLIAVVGCLYAAGVYLLLDRSLTRVLLGILVLSNATNVLLLAAGGPAGGPPIVGATAPEQMSDPLAQALILTAIVITLGMAAFLLSLIYRNWVLDRQERVVDDVEDREIGRRERDESEDTVDETDNAADDGVNFLSAEEWARSGAGEQDLTHVGTSAGRDQPPSGSTRAAGPP